MKLKITFFSAISALLLTACSSGNFSQSDLNNDIYNGYWAMTPVDDIHRVVKFETTGEVKIYDYTCDYQYQSYKLNGTERYYLTTIGSNTFNVLDENKKAFSKFEITQLTKTHLKAKQYFNDKSLGSLNLNYFNIKGAKPIC
ncbi:MULTISPECIES: hypothetical protein [Glaesserella]|uniref:Lipoprotein n=1 Tax=Glaesserella australis TaxID=2094024 RepID=A0A328BY12_9PAST|nr:MULTISPECIES: hypothetical protein [Glaesserella]AUI65640.1 hypothetical protein CJD39_03205 [Glaesserella sp. 15-184]RAL19073.1 hypothetical protein C5N92_04560 [Glaesserella australis]